jgi:site-specific recombinase XerD
LIAIPSAQTSAESGRTLRCRYVDYLRNEKGLSQRSIEVYLPHIDDFLGSLGNRRVTVCVRRLDAGVLRRFLLNRAQDLSGEGVRLLAVSLRCFLRFLHAQGEIPADLTGAIPTVRRRTPPGIPGQLPPEEVERVLAAPDQTCATGRRDRAILLLLARLGLRSREVLALELGDFRWRTGELLIRGKGGRQDLLPLPQDVGAAVARYLRMDRGVRSTERLFLRAIAPLVPLTGSPSIGHIVRRAMARAGVPRPRRIAAHLFRHTLASRMLQRGAHLQEIAEVLRHRAPSTTEIYAKIDMRSLLEVIRPWPIRGGAR